MSNAQRAGRLEGKVAVVTGAGAGIGRAIAELFAAEGALVFVADIDFGPASSVAAAISSRPAQRALAIQHDAGEETSWRNLLEKVDQQGHALNVLVNNAASGFAATIDQTSLEDWRAIDRVTGRGLFVGTKLAVARMAAEGSVVNVASIAAMGSISAAVYGASKAGVIAFTKAAAIHCARKGERIRVNAIAAGLIETDGLRAAVRKMTRGVPLLRPVAEWQMRRSVPLGSIGQGSDIAYAALFLASEEARYITGQTLVVDGGMTAPPTR